MSDLTKTALSRKIVKGNTFGIKIPMQQITGYDSQNNPMLADVDLTGCEADTSVTLHSMYGKTVKDFTISGINISFAVDGDLNNGQYDIEVKTVKNGQKLRMDLKNAFRIVNYNEDADLPSGTEFGVDTYTLQPQIVFAVGKDGDNGKSAYELAKENGFAGTVAEWLASLKGLQGYKGDKGDVGNIGPQGLKGDTGIQGPVGDTGIQGPKGEKGDKGDAFVYSDFTEDQILNLQKPAADAASDADAQTELCKTAELEREANEALRKSTEEQRDAAEEQRAAAESSRNATFEKLKGDSETATEHANTAAENANNEAIAAKKITQTVQSKLDELAGATTAIINISLSSNQANDDLTGKKIYVKSESGSIINTVTYTGTMLSIIIKSNTSFYVQAEPLSGYKQPQSETLTALASNTYAIDLVYKAELLSVTVTGPSDGVFNPNTVVVKINGVSYNGNATVKIPFGTTYTIIATKATGYISPASFSALIAENNTRNIILEYKASKFGVFIADIEKKLYTVEEYKASPLDASRVLGVAVITESYQFVCRFKGKSSIWQASGVLISGAASTDEVANTEALIAAYDEGDVKACVPAWYCHNFIFNNGERGFLPGVGVAQTIMLNAINDALVTIGDTNISNNIWTSVQVNAGSAYHVNSSAVAGNNVKGAPFMVVPCLLF